MYTIKNVYIYIYTHTYIFKLIYIAHIDSKEPGVKYGPRQYTIPCMTRYSSNFLYGSLKYIFWWPVDRFRDDEWYRNSDRSNDGKP